MRYVLPASSIIILATLAIFAQSPAIGPVTSVSNVDLNKYTGTWYEIAKYPNKFQKKCVGNTTATYTVKKPGRLSVVNRCLEKDGSMSNAKGAAKIADKNSNAKLKVRFAPSFLSFLPFVWADYWIIDLDPNYQYAVVATPDRKYFWILSREQQISDTQYQQILKRAELQGFDPSRIEKTPQGISINTGA